MVIMDERPETNRHSWTGICVCVLDLLDVTHAQRDGVFAQRAMEKRRSPLHRFLPFGGGNVLRHWGLSSDDSGGARCQLRESHEPQ
jgi:hypothetical protein